MKNPIKELKAIKNSIDESKKSMDQIKKIMDDVKTDVDEVKENLQHTMEHAKNTSQEAKTSADQLKQGLQTASSSIQQTKSNISSTKNDVTEGVGIIKEELMMPGGGFPIEGNLAEGTQNRKVTPTTASIKSPTVSTSGLNVVRSSDSESDMTSASSYIESVAVEGVNPGTQLIAGGQIIKEGTAFFLKKDNQVIGEITYIPGPDAQTWTLNHTYVDPRYRGGDIAKGLLSQVVQAARAENKKILPTCSYALAQFKRDRTYDDVWMK